MRPGRGDRHGVPIRPRQPGKVLLVCSTLDSQDSLSADDSELFSLTGQGFTATCSEWVNSAGLPQRDSDCLELSEVGATN
jgi:hypothetical protein